MVPSSSRPASHTHTFYITLWIAAGAEFETMVYNKRMEPASQEIHKITLEELEHQPKQWQATVAFTTWIYQLCRAAGGARPVFVAHNAR